MSDFFEILSGMNAVVPDYLKSSELSEQQLMELMQIISEDLRGLRDDSQEET